jgi:hypothetical protein
MPASAIPPRSFAALIQQAKFVQGLATGSYAFVGSAEGRCKIVDSVSGELLAV